MEDEMELADRMKIVHVVFTAPTRDRQAVARVVQRLIAMDAFTEAEMVEACGEASVALGLKMGSLTLQVLGKRPEELL